MSDDLHDKFGSLCVNGVIGNVWDKDHYNAVPCPECRGNDPELPTDREAVMTRLESDGTVEGQGSENEETDEDD